MKNPLLFLISLIFITSCTDKVLRPKITGVIVDENGIPVDSCKVGEAYTDKNGRFELAEITAKSFIFREHPVFVSEEINKIGFEKRTLALRKLRGGVPVGSNWDMDTIRLRKTISEFSQLQSKNVWLAGITKNFDTLFLTKKGLQPDAGKIDYIANYSDTYSRGYYFGLGNLPENVFERHIELDLRSPNLKVQRILIYGNKDTSEKTKHDTIYAQGTWKQEHKTISFNTTLPELNGVYKVVDFNYDSMKLVKE